MKTRLGRTIALPCALMLASFSMHAQSSSELRLSDGRVVEVIGLRRWTLPMLQDSLARYAPSDSLQLHSCAVALRYKLGFADAAATEYQLGSDEPARIVVSVREPQDSSRVRYRVLPMDTAPGKQAWRVVTEIARARPSAFWPAVYAYAEGDNVVTRRLSTSEDSLSAAAVIQFLRSHNKESDRTVALETLRQSPYMFDRTIAALILRNFPERDDTWHALTEAMRESDGWVKSVAALVLRQLSYAAPRPVNWSAVAPGIHAMLDGTSLFAMPTLVEVLSRTGAGPAQARAFLRNGGEMLVAYASSGTIMLSAPAHNLLVQLRGEDLGKSPEPWREWIESL